MTQPHTFAGSPLDRLDRHRRDPDWMAAQLEAKTTRFLAVSKLAPAVQGQETPGLAWCRSHVLDLRAPGSEPIFLGSRGDKMLFAVDVTGVEHPGEKLGLRDAEFPDLRAIATRLSVEDASIAAQARHMVDWHARHGFCPGCGQPTHAKDGGWARQCPSCDTEHFPRTDPVAIMLVYKDDRCLLGRQPAWPRPFFSALAGFVEAGETLEETVRREVMEEAGIEVGAVRYHSSQPWPFPASLMMGCMAEATSEDITVDTSELEEALWFTRDEARQSLRRPTDKLAVPPKMAIAHQLLRVWAEEG
ncbi:MAG: NAD(+) diphosphatase [Candidatus Binatia bacterium]|nr:NAD(+) diphosphatase [Candidatus Binatia bacterium]